MPVIVFVLLLFSVFTTSSTIISKASMDICVWNLDMSSVYVFNVEVLRNHEWSVLMEILT